MDLKQLLIGDADLASVRKTRLRTERELAVAKLAAVDADTAYLVALEDGASDEVLRAAVDKQQTASWAVARLSKKIAALTAQIATLEAQARAAQLKKHMLEVVNTALVHSQTAGAASKSYWSHMAARTAMFEAGFSRELDSVSIPPLFIADTSSKFSSDPASGSHDFLARWHYGITQLKQSLEAPQP